MRALPRFNSYMTRLVPTAALLACLLAPLAAGAQPKKVDFMADLVARGFFRGLVNGDAAALMPLCSERVSFDGRVVRGKKALGAALGKLTGRAKRLKLRLRRVVLMPYAEAVKRFGPPPARLREAGKVGRVVALGAFERGGAALILAREGRFWRVVALTD